MPVWIPMELLGAAQSNSRGSSPLPGSQVDQVGRTDEQWQGTEPAYEQDSWLPSAALVAHVHDSIRSALTDPEGVVRRRLQWLDQAMKAGRTRDVRMHDAAALVNGDICLDNVVNNPFFDLRQAAC